MKKVVRDAVIYTVLPKVSFIASLLILPVITPYLTLEDYGIYGLLMAYVSVFQIAITLGQNILLQNSFFTHKGSYKLVWNRCFGLMIIGGLICSFIFFIILYFTIMKKLGNNSTTVLISMGVYLTLSPLDIIVVNYYVLKEKALPYAYGAGLNGLLVALTTLIAIRVFKMGYLGWVISLPITILFSYIYYFRRIFVKERIYPQFNLKKRFSFNALKIGLPLTPHQLSLFILGVSDRLLLEYLHVPIKKIGLYSQGYNMGSQGSIIIQGLFQSMSKKLQDGFRSDTEESRIFIRNSMIVIPLLISAILFFASLWTKEVFFFLFRKAELREAYPIAIVVLCSYMFWSIYTFFTYPLTIKNQTFSVSMISLTAAGVNIVVNIILIPYFGIWAALGVTYFSYMIFGFAGLLNKENRHFLNKYINVIKLCIFLFGVNVILFVIAYLSKDIGFVLKGIFTLVLVILSGWLVKEKIIKKNYEIPVL
jgi:O-antigen/teichoic acid export membrane protein